MGKPKRFNSYDSIVAESRKLSQSYGQARQDKSTKAFRSMPQEPPITNKIGGTGTGDGKFLTASIAADQTTNIGANDHVEFDTKDEDGGVILQTGVGQADGVFELGGGTTYQLSTHLRPEFSGTTGQLVIAWYDITNSAEIGSRAIYETQTHASHNANQPIVEAIVTPATNIDVEVRIISVTALTALANEYCVANLFEIALGGSGSGGAGGGGTGVSFPITPTINDESDTWTSPVTIDLSLTTAHMTKFTLDADLTLVFSNPPASGTQIEFEIEFVQDATGGRVITFPASVIESVSISTAASSTTILTCRTNDGGTSYHVIPALRGSVSLGTSGLANESLSNLSGVAINTSLISDTDNTDDLGSASKEWKDLFVDGTANIDALRMGGDITMADNDVLGTGNVVFGTAGAAVAGSPTIWVDISGDMVLNVATSDQFFFTIQDTTEMSLTATVLNMANNSIHDINQLRLTGSSGDTNRGQLSVQSGAFDITASESGDEIRFFTHDGVSGVALIMTLDASSGSAAVAINDAVLSEVSAINFTTISLTPTIASISDSLIYNVGTGEDHEFQVNGTTEVAITATSMGLNGNLLVGLGETRPNADNISDLGTASLSWKDFYLAGFGELVELATPSNPPANSLRVYAVDDSTVTKLAYLDSAGTETIVGASDPPFTDTTNIVKGSADATKEIRFEVDGLTTGTVRVLTVPDANITIAGINLAQTWTADQTFTADLLSDGLNSLGTTAEPWNNIVSDNTLFCSNLKVFDTDSDINVFDDFDLQTGAVIDFADTGSTPGGAAIGAIVIKVNGTQRLVKFYST